MQRRPPVLWHLLFSCLVFLVVFSFTAWLGPAAPAQADQVTVTLDGLRDSGYVQIAADPTGDLASPGPADWPGTHWTDLSALYVAADAGNLYVYVDLPNYFSDGSDNDSSGQIGLAIEVDGEAGSGGSGDAWGNAITFAFNNVDGFASGSTFLPDYLIRGDVSNDGGWTELRTWNGNWNSGAGVNWGGISGGHVGTHIAYAPGQGVELAIPLADIGSPDPAAVRLHFFATQGGNDKGAYDTLPSDDQSTGWDDATIQTNLVSVPLAVDPAADLASPGPADWIGVAWTDLTRLHAWDDGNNLYLFIPMDAYTPDLSEGQIGLAIDTQTGGGSSDPWGNAITFAYAFTHQNLGQTPVAEAALPDYVIRGNVFGPGGNNGWTELRAWNGSDWNSGAGVDWGGIGDSGQPSQPGSKVAWSDGEGLRLAIPFGDVGVTAGDTVSLQFFATQGGPAKGAYDTVPGDDQSNGWDDPTTQEYLATYTIPGSTPPPPPGECASGAAQDNNVFWADLGHNSRDTLYRTPAGPVTTGTAVTLRLRTACDDLTAARLRLWDDRLDTQYLVNMTLVASDENYDWWEAEVPASSEPTLYWYRFIAVDGSATAYYEDDGSRDGGWGETFGDSPDHSWQLTVYDPAFQTPDWVKDGIIYQIFPDRFRNGDPANDPQPGRFFYGELNGTIFRSDPAGGSDNPWHTPICDPRAAGDCFGTYSLNFYGGDLQGVIDKLDYLEDLGVTILYFNPIFESPSNHKYDTTDYGQIAEDFGDLATFQALVQAAGARGISIVLDGVFNHTSSDSIYFDRYSRYDAAGDLTSPGGPGANDGSGACESPGSPYRDWYYFTDVTPGAGPCAGSDGTPNAATYESWFGFASLPKLNAHNQEVRDLVYDGGPDSVALVWLAEGARGWRFDVGADVDPGLTNDPGNDYWEEFRSAVRALDPDTYLVIEEWGNASPWLLGEEMDATMNYQYSSAMLSFWRDTTFVDNDHNEASSAGVLAPLSPSQLDARLHNWVERYPPEALYAMMNLLGSHDTNRPLFMLDENTSLNDGSLYQDANYDWSDAIERLKGVWLLQLTLPGAPTTYYGDEVGLVGPVTFDGSTWQDDPYNRLPFPWLDESGTPYYTHLQSEAGQDALRDYYKVLSGARNSHAALRTGSFDTLLLDDTNNVYAYGRLLDDYSDAAVVIVNRDGSAQSVTVDVSGYLPVGAHFTDLLNGGSYMVDSSGQITGASVPGMSGVLLVADSAMSAPPPAVNDLAVTAVSSDSVGLAWSAVAGADSYDVYRSLVSGGGYTLVANVNSAGYSDMGLSPATAYYYVVVSRDDSTGLVSGYSSEVQATPAYDLTAAWYNLQWPLVITHTISTENRTEEIYGQIWIDGVTDQPGPTPGLLAQVGFGPDGTSPAGPGWQWQPMSFNVDVGNNDEYVGTLLPDELGAFDYVTRYSGDGGGTWFYADLSGPGVNGNPGSLTVVAGDDTTAPAAPANLAVSGTSNSSVSLSWDANAEGDLAGYEVYRSLAGANAFDRVARLGATTTAYEDITVTTGATYDYYVVAFDTSFNRSAPSNIVTATAELRFVDVTFRVGVPAYTPGTVYLVGSIPQLGPWNPGLVPMTAVDATTWEYTLDILDGTQLEYKYTRGNWETVEQWGTITGLANRHVTISYGTDGTQLVDNTATDWGNGPDDQKAVQLWRDPIVVAHSPAADAIGVSWSTAVTVTWSEAMAANTTFAVTGPGGPVAGAFSYDGDTNTLTFTPDADLLANTTYSVSVSGQVDAGGDVQQVPLSWSFTTITIQGWLEQIIDEVEALVAQGTLNQGQGTSLIARLQAAINALNAGNKQPAINQLNAFVNQVNDFVNGGILTQEQGQSLIDLANSAIDQINQAP